MSTRAVVTEILAAGSPLEPSDLEDEIGLRELGLSSLQLQLAYVKIQESLGIRVLNDRDVTTIGDLVRYAEALVDQAKSPNVEDRALEASAEQRQFWLLERLQSSPPPGAKPHSQPFCRTAIFGLRGELDETRLERCLDRIALRHDAWRTHFALLDGAVWQHVASASTRAHTRVELEVGDDQERVAEVQRLLASQTQRGFDLSRAPLIRTCLIQLEARSALLVLVGHAAVMDRFSIGIFLDELRTLYDADADVAPLVSSMSYLDYTERQRAERPRVQQVIERHVAELGRRASPPPLASLRGDGDSTDGGVWSTKLEWVAEEAWKAFAQRSGAGVADVVLAALLLTVSAWSGARDLVIGVESDHRGPDVRRTIGCFSRVTPLHAVIDPAESGLSLVRRVRTMMDAGDAGMPAPIDAIVAGLNPRRRSGKNPLYDVGFCIEEAWPDSSCRGLTILAGAAPFEPEVGGLLGRARGDVELRWLLVADGAGFRLDCEYARGWAPETIEAITATHAAILESLVAHPERDVLALANVSTLRPRAEIAAPRKQEPSGSVTLPRRETAYWPRRARSDRALLEGIIGQVFAEALRIDRMEPESDFFEHGGTSLAAVLVRERLSARLAVDIDAVEVVRRSTARALAQYLLEGAEHGS